MSTQTFQYPPLSGPRCTRLVVLRPGKGNRPSDPLSCELVEIDVDDPPEYFALSYTWNGETPSEPLMIREDVIGSDNPTTSQLLVTPNCAAALKVLRKSLHRRFRRRKKVKIWIDAICINQASDDEKSVQVAMMSDVYRQATSVLVWLGQRDAPPNEKALLGSIILSVWKQRPYWLKRIPTSRGFYRLLYRVDLSVRHAALRCCDYDVVGRIILNNYWNRIWTLQEFSNTSIFILCRNSSLHSISSFGILIDELDCDTSFNSSFAIPLWTYFKRIRMHMSIRFAALGLPYTNALDVRSMITLLDVCHMQASDVRDKIFALRALSKDVIGYVAVDYSKPVSDIFLEASRLIIEKAGSLDLLYYVVHTREANAGADTWPSWVPDFGAEGVQNIFYGVYNYSYCPDFSAAATSKGTISFSPDHLRLSIRGTRIGHVGNMISDVFPVSDKTCLDKDNRTLPPRDCCYPDLNLLHRFASNPLPASGTDVSSSHATLSQRLYDFLKDINKTTNGFFISIGYEEDVDDFTEIESFISYVMSLHGNVSHPHWFGISTYRGTLLGGRLFCTADGKLGLGHPGISEGDEIWLVSGLPHPFVFRPQPGGEGHRVVGSVVVQDAMKGELWPENEDELEDLVIV